MTKQMINQRLKELKLPSSSPLNHSFLERVQSLYHSLTAKADNNPSPKHANILTLESYLQIASQPNMTSAKEMAEAKLSKSKATTPTAMPPDNRARKLTISQANIEQTTIKPSLVNKNTPSTPFNSPTTKLEPDPLKAEQNISQQVNQIIKQELSHVSHQITQISNYYSSASPKPALPSPPNYGQLSYAKNQNQLDKKRL